MKVIFAFLLTVAAVGCSHESAKPPVRPKSILILRHAEKPADTDVIHLSPEGTKRAKALPDLFKKTPTRPDPFPAPDFIFAAKASKRSNRSAETVTPLAKALELKVNAGYANDDYPKLIEELFTNPKYGGRTVLICWHHGNLPELALALGATGVPGKWKDSVFDQVWAVTFDDKGKAGRLAPRSQALMPGDAKE